MCSLWRLFKGSLVERICHVKPEQDALKAPFPESPQGVNELLISESDIPIIFSVWACDTESRNKHSVERLPGAVRAE